MVDYIKIMAEKYGNIYVLVDNETGIQVCDTEFQDIESAYNACEKLWPSDSVWDSRRVETGYQSVRKYFS